MTNKNMAFAGAGLLVIGLFTPIVTMPFLGTVNLFNNGMNITALALLALAAIGAGLALKDREADVIWPGVAAAGLLLFSFLKLQYALSQMREMMAGQLKDNPFAGIAQAAVGSIQIQWGWIILGLGAGLLIYAGVKARRLAEQTLFGLGERDGKIIAGASIGLALAAIAWDLVGKQVVSNPSATPSQSSALPITPTGPSTAATPKLSAEEAAYARNNVKLYDLEAKYYDSVLDGRVPGVDFKLKNTGNRTLNEVTVRVVFFDAAGSPIAEEEFSPVLVSEYSMNDDKPLRPNYIWQNEPDRFYSAKKVPNEWQEGKVTATVTEIEFGPNG